MSIDRKENIVEKSILQIHKEAEEARERRYFFCWCFKKEYLSFKPTEFGWEHDKRSILLNAVRRFWNEVSEKKVDWWYDVPNEFRLKLFYWFARDEQLPEIMKGSGGFYTEKIIVTTSEQFKVLEYVKEFIKAHEDLGE